MYTEHQGTDVQCSPISATCQCPSMLPVSAHQCHLPVPHQCHISVLPVHINATYRCPSDLPISAANQCHHSVPVGAAYQCPSVPSISAIS
ncbi:unnamed protein product, partial [Staurois parvus]